MCSVHVFLSDVKLQMLYINSRNPFSFIFFISELPGQCSCSNFLFYIWFQSMVFILQKIKARRRWTKFVRNTVSCQPSLELSFTWLFEVSGCSVNQSANMYWVYWDRVLSWLGSCVITVDVAQGSHI